VWRAGADAATTLQTGADLDIAGLNVPAGTYTLYVLVEDPENWKLIINNQTGQNGDSYVPRMIWAASKWKWRRRQCSSKT
jgi:hypothetical protein